MSVAEMMRLMMDERKRYDNEITASYRFLRKSSLNALILSWHDFT